MSKRDAFGDELNVKSTTDFASLFEQSVGAIGKKLSNGDSFTGEILSINKSRFEDLKSPVGKQKYFGKDGLYFCGFRIAPTGQFREIALDAKKIAADIATRKML